MPTNTDTAREDRVRRALHREGYSLMVPRGRWRYQYGPYATVEDRSNCLASYGVSLEELEADLGLA